MESKNHVVTEGQNNTVTSTGTEQNAVQELQTPFANLENTSTEDEINATKDAQLLLGFIKEKDADKLLHVLNSSASSPLDIEGVNTILEGFDLNYDLDTLSVQINNAGLAMHPEGGQYEFILVDKNFKEFYEENSLVILYQDGGIVYLNPYLRYFPYAEKMVLKYIDLINEENTTELAGFLNPDDVAVPDWVADTVVRNYKDFFNSGNMSIRYINHFTFVIENSEGKEHEIEVIYGDGLMGIKDNFIPDF